MSFNTSKSSFMRCGPRFNKPCGKLLNGTEIRKSSDVKYLGTCFRAGKKLLFNIDHLKMAFYRAFNAIYSKCCAANSELACVFLLRSMCFPIIHYALESTAPTKTNCTSIDRMIDNCLMKIFATRNELIIKNCRVAFNIPSTTLVYELRACKYLSKLRISQCSDSAILNLAMHDIEHLFNRHFCFLLRLMNLCIA